MLKAAIEAEVLIHASPEATWAVLTDFDSYPEWNPFIRCIEGRPYVGERLRIELRQSPDAAPMRFSPRVLTSVPGCSLVWLGRLGLPGVLDGEHSFRLFAHRDGTRFQQGERFFGLLVPLLRDRLLATTLSFEAMNAALKARVEATNDSGARDSQRRGSTVPIFK